MNKLLLTLFLAPMALFSEIDESKLVIHLHDRIDEISYQITHSREPNDSLLKAFMLGQFSEINRISYKIDSGLFEQGLSEPDYPSSPKGMNGVHRD